MTKAVGIIDEPVAPGATDNLDINIHSKSLIDFIKATSTPITVGIQGEWGSGKTSLINSIHHSFDNKNDFKQIWINSWEYSLLSTPEEALLKIVNRIIDDLVAQDTNKKRLSSIKSGAESIFKGALRVGAGMTMGMEAANVAKELLETSEQTISALRKQLSDVVNESKFNKIIIYVDDLDRIEPRNAVAILELLKNIFSVPRCVFILAIDYQVVVKGLEHKFGKQTAQNEWEFRAFFDKIIQLPFMMPMGQYNIGKYVNSLLIDIGFVEEPGLDDESVRQIVLQTIGGNPRSIKRLVNSVSLIQIFVENKANIGMPDDGRPSIQLSEENQKFMMFSLLCLQIAFPAIYSLLTQEPDFTSWDENFSFKQTNRSEERLGDLKPEEMKQIFDEEFNAAKATEDFDEEWEQALFRICYVRPRLKPRVGDISKFFSHIKDELLTDNSENIGAIISQILEQTSVTSVESTDQGQPPLPEREGAYKRRILDGIEHWKLDKKVNRPGGISEEQEQIIDIFYKDINEEFPDTEFLFAGGMSGYVNKHKFFGSGPSKKTHEHLFHLHVLKHFLVEYKAPNIPGTKMISLPKVYQTRNINTLKYADRYDIRIHSLDEYSKYKKIIFQLISLSYDIAKNHWDGRLIFRKREGSFSAKNISFKNDEDRMWEMADKYMDLSHRYDATNA